MDRPSSLPPDRGSNVGSVMVVHQPDAFRASLDHARHRGSRVALVPTMGALHAGHMALVADARTRVGHDGIVAVSVFVNPTQFGPNEDFARYPHELDADVARCAEAGVDLVFAPSPDAMYPAGDQTRVHVGDLAQRMCGPFRPGHFEGVATVVAKLFALSSPCTAVFGRKDYQQLLVIRRMARDLFLAVDVEGHATLREADGLAMSSRNRYLAPADRARAVVIPRALGEAVRAWQRGDRDLEAIRARVERSVRSEAETIDYVEAHDADTLGPWNGHAPRALIALAARLGGARLIDNVVLGEDAPPA